MGKRTSYSPGTFSWVELLSPDAGASKSFYGELLGWEAEDLPLPGGGSYTMLRLDGDTVAGLHQPAEEQPPAWLVYVTVADVDASAERAAQLDGAVMAGPFDVMESGRMAVAADPAGAAFGMWQARGHIGATRVNEVGCLAWCDLSTTDIGRAAEFYGGLFGWEVEAVDTDDGPPYSIVRNDGVHQAGIAELPDVGVPAHWLPYFTVPSTDGALERALSLEAEVLGGPMDVPAGRIAALRDPQGAAFAVFAGEVDD